jgi:hypothetical protein
VEYDYEGNVTTIFKISLVFKFSSLFKFGFDIFNVLALTNTVTSVVESTENIQIHKETAFYAFLA